MIRTVKYWALAALVLLGACDKHDPKPVPIPTQVIKGADISWVTEMESKGFKFYNAAGQERELTALMKEIGMNAVRLRVWVNPEGGWNGKADVVKKANITALRSSAA